MKIILSPTKKMREDRDSLPPRGLPVLLDRSRELLEYLRSLSSGELQKLWGCNASIARQNVERLRVMDLEAGLSPAIMSYEGIAFQYMAPAVFEYAQLEYVQEKLRILSGFYGILKPLDGIRPYRLEMQAKAALKGCRDLYEFWGDSIYRELGDENETIINLASKEYSRCIEKYLSPERPFISCVFAEEQKGKLIQKGTFAKMARGEMVRYMAEGQLEKPEDIKSFDRLNYRFREDVSTEREYVFQRIPRDKE